MRILVLTPTFSPVWGGAERLLHEVFCRIGERHTVHIVTPIPPLHIASNSKLKEDELPYTIYRYSEKYRGDRMAGRRFHKGFFPPFELAAIPAVWKQLHTFQPDMISAFYAIPTGLAALTAKWRFNIPLVLSFIGRDVPGPNTPPGWKFYDRQLGKAADEITYISDYCRTAIFSNTEIDTGITVSNGVQVYATAVPEKVQALRQQLGLVPGTIVLFALQRLALYKGVDILIKSMAYLRDLPCVLLIAGSGADSSRLEALIEEQNLQGKVQLLGFVAEETLSALWDLTDIFVFHSYYETFGMVLAEAMQAGKAVVSVQNTAIPEVVTHNQDGLLVPTGNAAAMSEAIRQLILNPEQRADFATSGKAKAEQKFSWDTVANAYEDVFINALHKKRYG